MGCRRRWFAKVGGTVAYQRLAVVDSVIVAVLDTKLMGSVSVAKVGGVDRTLTASASERLAAVEVVVVVCRNRTQNGCGRLDLTRWMLSVRAGAIRLLGVEVVEEGSLRRCDGKESRGVGGRIDWGLWGELAVCGRRWCFQVARV